MLINGDCIEEMKTLISDGVQVDSVVCDPPYEIGFMGKGWDSTGIAFQKETWELVFQLLKPGGHLLAFSASRTYHRMAVAVEDAGFEIRDQIMWLYGSGFPKSHNIGKTIDRKAGAKRKVTGKGVGKGGENLNKLSRENKGDAEEAKGCGAYGTGAKQTNIEIDITEPATPEAKQWDGWGTALKPAHEPVVMARKPLSEKTVSENVLKYGTGGINIDDCRIGTEGGTKRSGQADYPKNEDGTEDRSQNWARVGHSEVTLDKGRYPANVMHDGSDAVTGVFPQLKGKSRGRGALSSGGKIYGNGKGIVGAESKGEVIGFGDEGSAARFFYCPKVSKSERGVNNNHPTVKPIKLMEYLCRLVTPKGGIVLDPFMGSGTTIMAAKNGGFKYIGIEKEKEYFEIANSRIDNQPKNLVDFL